MNFLSSKRLVTTALVLLTVLNMALLGVLWWQNIRRPAPVQVTITRQFSRQMSFTEPLTLNESQTVSFRNLRKEYFLKVRPEMQAIALLKKQLVEESLKDQPDTKKIEAMANSIGSRQATIERELALHFHELAKVCTPAQRDSLKTLLDRIATRRGSNRNDRWFNSLPPTRVECRSINTGNRR